MPRHDGLAAGVRGEGRLLGSAEATTELMLKSGAVGRVMPKKPEGCTPRLLARRGRAVLGFAAARCASRKLLPFGRLVSRSLGFRTPRWPKPGLDGAVLRRPWHSDACTESVTRRAEHPTRYQERVPI